MTAQHGSPAAVGHLAPRPDVRGKFIYLGDEKYWVRGTTYGAFPPHARGDWFPDEDVIVRDFILMREAGINTILTYTVPSSRVLDLARQYGLKAIINIPWFGCDYQLESTKTKRKLLQMVREAVAPLREHPALLMWCVGKELPPAIVRWYGKLLIENLIRSMYDVAKAEDPGALVSFTSFPTTEYLDLSFVDVYTFNVYLHTRSELHVYLARLQHVAGELPLVVTEFGMCSLRHGLETQAIFLRWQLQEIVACGAAGALVFGWLDPFYGENELVKDWHFGLVDAERNLKPSYYAVQSLFTAPFPLETSGSWPRISVVIAAYNAESTLGECLSSLKVLAYPDYEVIVVDDGSTDGTRAIATSFPFHVISTPNEGVSAARNEGMRVATGEIVAYLDADAFADPDWLLYMAMTFTGSDFKGVGGPNVLPSNDEDVALCVYRAPGGPTHVMMDDLHAEHIPGCNMAFKKSALEAIGGFDPIFTKAGDDVDVCWRLLETGGLIGFSPAALVWHHRRPSVRTFWSQQVGYGTSEALLEKKHPRKFNRWGHALWVGRIYSPYPVFRLFSRPLVYHGLWGTAPFQPMYDGGSHHLLEIIPRAPEWYGAVIVLFIIGIFFHWFFIPAVVALGYTLSYAIVCGSKVRLGMRGHTKGWFWSFYMHTIIAWLHLVEPAARSWGRLKGGLTPWRQAAALSKGAGWARSKGTGAKLEWADDFMGAREKAAILGSMTARLDDLHCAVHWNLDTDSWDLQVRRGMSASLTLWLLIEHRGGVAWRARWKAISSRSALADGLVGASVIGSTLGLYLKAPIFAGIILSLGIVIFLSSHNAQRRLRDNVCSVADEVMITKHESLQRREGP